MEFIFKNLCEITHNCTLRLIFTLLNFSHPISNYLVHVHNYARFKSIPPLLLISMNALKGQVSVIKMHAVYSLED